ncbi:MAG: TonB-dependent receptor [Opitutae bacterium]|nr:TonB-dependent receptor [Opitutae bacterium]
MKNYQPEVIGRALRAAVWAGAGFSLFAAGPVSAQQASDAAPDDKTVKLEKFIVTGSNIPSYTEDAKTFPVSIIDRKLIDQSGLQNTAELLQKITLANGGSVPFTNNATGFTPGAASTSLRGLGPDATLVLINGRRMAFYPVGTGGTVAFVDLNTIPLAAVESIEVLKDGASAVYGADAVAGVVNIIFRKNYNGAEASFTLGNTTNKDSTEANASFLFGVTNEKSSLTVGVNFYKRNAIFNHDRSYSAVPPFLSSNSSPGNFQVSRAAIEQSLGLAPGSALPGVGTAGTANSLFFVTSGPNLPNTLTPAPGNQNANNNGLLPASVYTIGTGRTSSFNFNEFSGSFPEITRNGVFASFERQLYSDKLHLYGDMFFNQAHQIDELAPFATGNFSTPGQTPLVIPARTPNPILTAEQIAAGGRAAPIGSFNPFNPFNQDISGTSRIRLAEFGNRIFHNRNTAFAVTGGVRAANLWDKFNFDAGIRFSTITNQVNAKLISTSRFLRILNAADPIFNPASPSFIGSTVPYNPFGYFRNPIPSNAVPVNFALHNQRDENTSSLAQAGFTLNTGNLFTLPAGDVGFAFGMELRREAISQSPDSTIQAGDILTTPPLSVTQAQRKIASYFAEAELPIFSEKSNVPFARRLSLNVAARYEDFVTSKRNTFVPKFGLRWEPFSTSELVFRGSWGKGFREPSLFELFSGKTSGLTPISDPATGNFEPEQNITQQGNRQLKAETSIARNIGVVWQPKGRLQGFTAAFDLWRITREGTPAFNHQDTVDRAVGRDINGVARPGGLQPGESIVRDGAGNLVQINAVYLNAGETIVAGFDTSASYTWKTENWGRIDLGATATYLSTYKNSTVAGVAPVEFVDSPIAPSDDAFLRWKGQSFVSWTWKGATSRLAANYTGGFDDLDANGNPFRVASTLIYDFQLSYNLFPSTSAAERTWWSDLKLSAGVNNLFDKDPPFASGGGGNSNGYPGFIYSDVGRFVYFGIEKKL